MPIRTFALSVVVTAVSAGAAWADSGPIAHRADITLSAANQLLDATLAACHRDGRTGVAAIVDRSGNLVALQRDDNVGPHNTVAAQRKAFTALSTKTPTGAFAERARSNPDTQNLNTLDELLLLGGGIPLKVGNDVVGAIGVAGTGGGASDEGCAREAMAKILSNTK